MHGGFDAHDRAGVEILGEHLRVDGGGGHDHLEVGPLRQNPLHQAEDEVDVERTLVRLVDQQRRILAQVAVVLEFLQQYAIGHHLDPRVSGGGVLEPHLVRGDRTGAGARGNRGGNPGGAVGGELRENEVGHRHRGDAARLGDSDAARVGVAGIVQDAGKLGGLARPGRALHHDHRVGGDLAQDLVTVADDRQRRG